MTGILIATHHNLAGAFLETVEMIAGKHDFVESVGLWRRGRIRRTSAD